MTGDDWQGGWGGGSTERRHEPWAQPMPYAPPPAGDQPRWRGRQRTVFRLGVASVLAAVAAFPVLLVGGVTFLFGGFVLTLLALLMVLAALALSVVGVFVGGSSGGPAAGRVRSMLPALLTLLTVGPMLASFVASEVKDSTPATPFAHEFRDLPPDEVVESAAKGLSRENPLRACRFLAERARIAGCERDERLVREPGFPGAATVVRSDGPRALVRFKPWAEPPHQVRLVREGGAWRLLDLPGLPSRCVDTARDPFRCPVVRYGTRPLPPTRQRVPG